MPLTVAPYGTPHCKALETYEDVFGRTPGTGKRRYMQYDNDFKGFLTTSFSEVASFKIRNRNQCSH
jgi:hypothetical protein